MFTSYCQLINVSVWASAASVCAVHQVQQTLFGLSKGADFLGESRSADCRCCHNAIEEWQQFAGRELGDSEWWSQIASQVSETSRFGTTSITVQADFLPSPCISTASIRQFHSLVGASGPFWAEYVAPTCRHSPNP